LFYKNLYFSRRRKRLMLKLIKILHHQLLIKHVDVYEKNNSRALLNFKSVCVCINSLHLYFSATLNKKICPFVFFSINYSICLYFFICFSRCLSRWTCLFHLFFCTLSYYSFSFYIPYVFCY
jgi:hypothetical protein